jgi:hypothetical protein
MAGDDDSSSAAESRAAHARKIPVVNARRARCKNLLFRCMVKREKAAGMSRARMRVGLATDDRGWGGVI